MPGLRVNMSEDELLAGITDALTIAGWRWTHIRRSDGVTMGHSGLPDIIAAHPGRAKAADPRPRMLVWELKGDGGVLSIDQVGWQLAVRGIPGVDARVIYPTDYDDALSMILGR